MSWFKPTNLLDKTYEVGIILKGLDGALEVASAILLLLISSDTISRITRDLTQHELSTDPHDFIANAILHSGQHLASGGTTFAVAYLLAHGLIKLVVVISLLMQKPWAYPFALITLGLFLLYQLYLLIVGPSLGLVTLSVFDLAIIWLVWREYKTHRPQTLQVLSTE